MALKVNIQANTHYNLQHKFYSGSAQWPTSTIQKLTIELI